VPRPSKSNAFGSRTDGGRHRDCACYFQNFTAPQGSQPISARHRSNTSTSTSTAVLSTSTSRSTSTAVLSTSTVRAVRRPDHSSRHYQPQQPVDATTCVLLITFGSLTFYPLPVRYAEGITAISPGSRSAPGDKPSAVTLQKQRFCEEVGRRTAQGLCLLLLKPHSPAGVADHPRKASIEYEYRCTEYEYRPAG